MKTWRFWILFICFISGTVQVTAAQVNPCHSGAPADVQAFALEALAELKAYHDKGYCGQGIRIGVIASALPTNQPPVSTLQELGKLTFVDAAQLADWQNQRPPSQIDDGIDQFIEVLNAVAPDAQLYLYRLDIPAQSSSVTNTNLKNGLGKFQENQVQYIVNTVTQLFSTDDDEQQAIQQSIESLWSQPKAWINTAGNYGRSFYETTHFTALRDLNAFYDFGSATNGLLQVIPLQTAPQSSTTLARELPWLAQLVWTNRQVNLKLLYCPVAEPEQCSQPQDEPGISELERLYRSIRLPVSTSTGYLAVMHDPTDQPLDSIGFKIYLSGAVLPDSYGMIDKSIPFPNNLAGTWTVGALPARPETLYTWLTYSEDSSSGKPEFLASGYATAAADALYGSGIASMYVAGAAAVLNSRYPEKSAAAIMTDLQAQSSKQEREASTPPKLMLEPLYSILDILQGLTLPLFVVVAGVLVAAVVAIAFLVYRMRRAKAYASFKRMVIVSKFSDDGSKVNFALKPPFRANGFPAIRRYMKEFQIEITFLSGLEEDSEHTVQFDTPLQHSISIGYSLSLSPLNFLGLGGSRGHEIHAATYKVSADGKTISITITLAALSSQKYDADQRLAWEIEGLKWSGSTRQAIGAIRISSENNTLLSTSFEHEFHSAGQPEPIRESRTTSLFISYSRRDIKFVKEFIEFFDIPPVLETWIDYEDIVDGSPSFVREIQRGLDQSDAMLLFLSPDSIASAYVKHEWLYFLGQADKKRIYVLVYKDCIVPDELKLIQHEKYAPAKRRDVQLSLLRAILAYRESQRSG